MITGDNPLTAAAIARQAGVDDFLAEAKPEDKMALHQARTSQGQTGGHDRATAPTTLRHLLRRM